MGGIRERGTRWSQGPQDQDIAPEHELQGELLKSRNSHRSSCIYRNPTKLSLSSRTLSTSTSNSLYTRSSPAQTPLQHPQHWTHHSCFEHVGSSDYASEDFKLSSSPPHDFKHSSLRSTASPPLPVNRTINFVSARFPGPRTRHKILQNLESKYETHSPLSSTSDISLPLVSVQAIP